MRYRVWYGIVEENMGYKIVEEKIDFESKNSKLPFNLKELAVGRIFENEEDYYFKLRREAIAYFREKAKKELKRDDRYAIMLLKLLDEIDESINLLENKLMDVEEVRESEVTKKVREELKSLKILRKDIEKEIEGTVEKFAPNLHSILGGVIAARILEKAGSLKRMAEMPASTIQILGAEKSLYKAIARMKKGKKAKTPKHGVIFQHPFIRTLSRKKRGKMARFMAAKLAIAARIDYFSGELREELSQNVRMKYERMRRG
jgi:nucleolar protein 56